MSEYQWVEFRAVDGPLDDASIEFMHEQSTRAEISRWSFTNEYHFGSFRGDWMEMLRRGYDVHVHFANYGIRRLSFRIPDGFAYAEALESYLLEAELEWNPDEEGTGGILTMEPEGDAGTWDWMENVESLASDIIPIREMIIAGDFRPLYIAHLEFNYDDDALEPPVPAGLRDQQFGLDRLCSFYQIDLDLVTVAAETSPELARTESESELIRAWLKQQSKAELAANLENCLCEPNRFPSRLLRNVRAEFAKPTTIQSEQRTIGELRRRAGEISAERTRQRKAAAAEEAARRKVEAEKTLQKKLAAIAENPEKTIRRIDAAIEEKNRPAYQRAAVELSMLAKACGKPMAAAKADAIRAKYPTRSALSSEFKKAGF